MSNQIINRIILYRGKRVKIIELAQGFVNNPFKYYWIRAIEPVAGYNTGSEFIMTAKTIKAKLAS